jgi:hypothetical protein
MKKLKFELSAAERSDLERAVEIIMERRAEYQAELGAAASLTEKQQQLTERRRVLEGSLDVSNDAHLSELAQLNSQIEIVSNRIQRAQRHGTVRQITVSHLRGACNGATERLNEFMRGVHARVEAVIAEYYRFFYQSAEAAKHHAKQCEFLNHISRYRNRAALLASDPFTYSETLLWEINSLLKGGFPFKFPASLPCPELEDFVFKAE